MLAIGNELQLTSATEANSSQKLLLLLLLFFSKVRDICGRVC